jgi:hypothetical protein|tara:strand:+ start:1588 stop:1761 length:174 start_codon:yes stop_codon:yes gene_type:complete
MEPAESKSKKHFYISLIKSVVRILGCCAIFIVTPLEAVLYLSLALMGAEVLGIVEEL